MGTIDHHLGSHRWDSGLTTPDPLTLHRRLSEFRALGASAAVFEVSSHALDQKRVENIPFDVAVFTNLTRDHLDYHKTMENYFAAKQRLFADLLANSKKSPIYAIVNVDDDWGRRLRVADRARVWTFGQKNADFQFRVGRRDFSGTEFEVETPRGKETFKIPIPGLHNVYNATGALAVCVAAGASLSICQEALRDFNGVPGRLQRVPTKRDLHVFVDYAHTDDALRVVLSALQEVRAAAGTRNKIITVFGCGGDRDAGKRPLMAKAALEGSDQVLITSDNPRSEDPEKIIAECVAGLPSHVMGERVWTEVDRRRAIGRALQSASSGDVILIAGKGHEEYQIVGSEKRPFSDVQVVKEWLKQIGE
jgi:UDP-N-acetylmuramoyl-L-alanyl-D-glutamate--2,6-diaminopimelate ligase